jgi:membrane protease YdiL (CAAX protease family)
MSAARAALRRRPVTAFLLLTFGILGTSVGIPRLAGHSIPAEHLSLVLSALAFVLLFGGAVLVTAVADGRPGVRRLASGLTRWRIGVSRWLLVIAALPALTLIIAGATGTLRHPPEGWPRMALAYLVTGLVAGTLLTNVWEEAAWAGFVQHRLMTRHGLLAGSLRTAVPFTLIHVPGTFQNKSAGAGLVTIVVLAVVAPFLRYLIGAVFIGTGGSVLAAGVLHASFNGAGQLSAAEGGWQFLPALMLLTLAVGVHRRLRHGSRTAHPAARKPVGRPMYARVSPEPSSNRVGG